MSLKQIERDYYEFHGETPDKIVSRQLPDQDFDAWHLGEVTAIAYRTPRDGKMEEYQHEFEYRNGPDIAVDSRGRAYLTGGDYSVTDSGFEDETMPRIRLVNPHQRGAPAKVVKMAKTRRNKKGQFVKTARKSNPAPRRASRKRATRARRAASPNNVIILQEGASPVRKTRRRRKSNPIVRRRRHHMRRRRNPVARRSHSMGGKGNLNIAHLIMPAVAMGIGAVGTSVAFGVIEPYLPANLTSGPFKGGAKALAGVALGMVVSKVVSRKIGADIALGALTVGLNDAITPLVPSSWPMGAMYQMHGQPAYRGLGAAYGADMGAMITDRNLGWATAANVTTMRERPAYGAGLPY